MYFQNAYKRDTFACTGEAGKTTFIKQMRIIHGVEYDENEILEFKKTIFQNIYDAIAKLGDAMIEFKISYRTNLPEVSVSFRILIAYRF
ncbi:guanine nucleotide-binding protein (G protein), subunit alpha [Oopsacas minuta]|uniref:Guanine nucleotide-binding protein (G protein), subunit alpha n=1 Tax=Oopsacas minuta TaxID=111878 RepID=A0AAV7JBX9_9METZ|nr:guanine nucleotide-binding protein (G protein), subunit alpha [Oopsacas minuta]